MFKLPKMKINRDKAAKKIGLIGGSLGILLTLLQVFSMVKPSKHELSIQIPKSTINNSTIQFAMAFYNTGDYNEIITDISCYFVENFNLSGKENNIEIAKFDSMILIDSKKSIKEIIEGKIDLNRKPFDILLKTNTQYTIVLGFRIVSEEGRLITEKLPIGSILLTQDSATGSYTGNLELVSEYKTVDFRHSKPVLTITNFPRTTEYDIFKLERVQ